MENNDQFSDFIKAVEALHDDGPVRITAHTSNTSAHGWDAITDAESPVTEPDTQ